MATTLETQISQGLISLQNNKNVVPDPDLKNNLVLSMQGLMEIFNGEATGEVTKSGNNAFTGNNTFAGTSGINGVATFGANPTFAAGKTLDLDSTTTTLSSNAATITKYATLVTSEALTTAAGASQAFVITLVGIAAGDFVLVQYAGGTNTRRNITFGAVTTTDTITITLYNNEPVNAVNGTVKFYLWSVKS